MIIRFSEIRYAFRLLSKAPAFTVLTVTVMSAGIGLSVFMFSLLNTFFYEPLPFKDSHSLVRLTATANGARNPTKVNPLDYLEIKSQVEGLSEICAYDNVSISVVGRDGAVRYKGAAVEANFFQMSRTKPVLGREFTPSDNLQGAEPVTILSYDMWQTKYHADPKVLNETLRIDGTTHKIVGVMPENYYFPASAEIWTALQPDSKRTSRNDRGRDYHVIAHVADGNSIDDVDHQLALIMKRIEDRYPDTNSGIGVSTTHFKGRPSGVFVHSMRLSAILILILASLNVGNLLFSRAIERAKETAIRAALGAPRWVLMRQMLLESAIICSAGGLIGLVCVGWFLEITGENFRSRFIADRPFFWWDFGIDAFTIKLSLCFVALTIFLTGFLPAWRNSGTDVNRVLRDGTRGALGKTAGRLSRLLVISEVFISMTVLLTAGMLIVSSYKMAHAPTGADTQDKFIGKIVLPRADYDTPEKQALYVRSVQSRLENSNGIGEVMIVDWLPGDGAPTPTIAIEGMEYVADNGYPRSNYTRATTGSLGKLGIGLVEGRYFNNSDTGIDKKTIIVTESFAKRHFAGESAVGKRVRLAGNKDEILDWLTIVGVVEHTSYGSPLGDQAMAGAIIRPYSQAPLAEFHIVMEMKASRSVVFDTMRRKMASIDSNLPAYRFETYEGRRKRVSGGLMLLSQLFLIFGIVAVFLAATGIYGVTANTVNQRIREIGVKRALGALESRISNEYLLSACRQLLWGGIPGLLIGCGFSFAMSNQFGVEVSELMIILIPLTSIIASVVLLSTLIPTKRVLAISPSDALRHE